MNKRLTYGIIIVLFLSLLFLGGSISSSESTEVDSDYDTSFYVDDSDNLFIKLAKILDRCCFFIVDIVISGISNLFDMILGF